MRPWPSGLLFSLAVCLCSTARGQETAELPLWWPEVQVPAPRADTWDGAFGEAIRETAEPPSQRVWFLAGPFRLAGSEADPGTAPAVDRVAENGTLRYGGRSWRLTQRQTRARGRVDLAPYRRQGDAVFAAAEIQADHAGPARLFLSGEAAVTAWVNGERAARDPGTPVHLHRRPDSEFLDVNLREGRNTLLLKVAQTSMRTWWFAARVGRHARHRVRIKVLVTLAERLGTRYPDRASLALVEAAELLLAAPEDEDQYAVALLDRVRAWRQAPSVAKRQARAVLIAHYRRTGAVREQVRVLVEAVADLERAESGRWPALRESPTHARLLFALAEAQFRSGQVAEAVATYERLVGRFQSGRHAADALLAIARRYRQMSLREQAEPLCRSVLRILDGAGTDANDSRRATAQAILDWAGARWADRPHLERDFEAERLIQRAEDLIAAAHVEVGSEPPAPPSPAETATTALTAALRLYTRAADRGGEAVLPLADGRIVGVRPHCHARIRALLERGDVTVNRRLYEQQVGDAARELLRQAEGGPPAGRIDARGLRTLRAVASRYPFSPSAERALDRLGNDALTWGRFGEGALCFGRLLHGGPAAGLSPGADAGRRSREVTVAAKAAFCAARQSAADAPWIRLKEAGAEAVHVVTGRRSFSIGAPADHSDSPVPQRWLEVRKPPSPAGRQWPTFGGSADRPRLMIGRRSLGPHAVTVPFADSAGAQVSRNQTWPNVGPGPAGLRLVHHAAVVEVPGEGSAVDGPRTGSGEPRARALFHTDRMLYAVDVASGRMAWRFGRWWGLGHAGPADNRWSSPQAFFTTVAEGRAYVRLRVPRRSAADRARWAVYAVSAANGRLVWSTEARRLVADTDGGRHEDEEVVGEPAFAFGQVYVLVRVGGEFPRYALVALRADSGQVVWQTVLCSGPGALRVFAGWPGGVYPVGDVCPPPTAAGDAIIVVTNLGYVCAVDGLTGDARWVFRYERSFLTDGRSDQMRRLVNRDVVPAAVRGDCVVVCPRDTGAVYALETATGRLRWRLDLYDVRRIIGCDDRNVYLDGEALLCVDLVTGAIRWRHVTEEDPSVGNGVLVGRRLLIPTEERLVLRSAVRARVAGSTPWPAGVGPVGNLLLVGDQLLSFGREGLTIFSHEDGPLAVHARAQAALTAAEAAANEGAWDEAERLAAAVTASAATPDHAVRADVVRTRAAFERRDMGRAAAIMKRLRQRHGGRLIRLPDRWASVDALLAEYVPDAPGTSSGGVRRGKPLAVPHLDLESVISAEEPIITWPDDEPPVQFLVVSGRWVECRRVGAPHRTAWRAQIPFEASRVIWTTDRVLLSSAWEVLALSRGSGRLIWQYVISGPLESARGGGQPWPPGRQLMADTSVVVTASAGRLAVLNAETGQPRWTRALGRREGLVALWDGLVHVGRLSGERSTLTAFDGLNGARRWEVPVGPDDRRRVSAQVDGGLWLASGATRSIVKIDLSTGRTLASSVMPPAWGKGIFHDLRRVGPALVGLFNTGARWRGGEVFWRVLFDAKSLKPLARVRGEWPVLAWDRRTLLMGDGAALSGWDVQTGDRRWQKALAEGSHVLAAGVGRGEVELVVEQIPRGGNVGALWRVRYRQAGEGLVLAGRERLAGRPPRLGVRRGRPAAAWVQDRFLCATGDGAYVYRERAPEGAGGRNEALAAVLAAEASPNVPPVDFVRAARFNARPRLTCTPARAPMIVDGRLDDWRDGAAVRLSARHHTRRLRVVQAEDDTAGWDGPKDLAARLWVAHDERALYVAVEVTDEVHRPAGPGAALWRGDAVELVLQGRDSGGPVPGTDILHVAAAYRNGRSVTRILHLPSRAAAGIPGGLEGGGAGRLDVPVSLGRFGDRPGITCAVRRDEKSVVYEWAIPRTALTGSGRISDRREADGGRIGFGLLISDDDGEGVEGGLEFGAGLAGGVVPDLLGSLELSPK